MKRPTDEPCHRQQKLSDKTDSDATSGIGVEIAAVSTSSESEKQSDRYICGTYQRRLSRFNISTDSTMNQLRRSSSIYDNLNTIEDSHSQPNSINDESTIAVLEKDIIEQMDSITRMLDEVQFQFDKEATLRRTKKTKFSSDQTLQTYIEQNYSENPTSYNTSVETNITDDLQRNGLPSDGKSYCVIL